MTTEIEKINPIHLSMDEYMSQRRVWLTKRSETGYWSIKDMDRRDRAQAALWLERHAMPLIALVEHERHATMIWDSVGTLSDILDLVASNPKSWIRETELFKALTEGIYSER